MKKCTIEFFKDNKPLITFKDKKESELDALIQKVKADHGVPGKRITMKVMMGDEE